MKVFIQKPCDMLRRYPFSITCITVIWVLCLIPIPENPLSHVNMIDKWTHFVMYGSLCLILWAEHGLLHHRLHWRKAVVRALLMPVLMGGLIELVQATCTGGNRSGDWIDFAADAIGVGLGQIIGIPLAVYLSRRNRG